MIALFKIASHSLHSSAVSSRLSEQIRESAWQTEFVFIKGHSAIADKVLTNPSVQKTNDWFEFESRSLCLVQQLRS